MLLTGGDIHPSFSCPFPTLPVPWPIGKEDSVRIALVSLDQVWEDKEANRVQVQHFIKRAASDTVDIVVFPEMTLTGFSMNVAHTAEKAENLVSLTWYQQQARQYRIGVIGGYTQYAPDGRGMNCAAIVAADGTIACTYTKVHPFSFAQEDTYFVRGESLGIGTVGTAEIGLAICYDLRFPELYQMLSSETQMIVTIANWPASREMHWRVLLQGRAIENQVFTVGVNRTGRDPAGLSYPKSSVIFSPLGEPVQPVISDDLYDVYAIDLAEVERVRNTYQFKQDRREDWYIEKRLSKTSSLTL